MKCFLCAKNDYFIFNINNFDICSFCIKYMNEMLKDKYEDIFYKKQMIYLSNIGWISCKYCDWFMEKFGSSLHHCIIPMKNKYMNINVL